MNRLERLQAQGIRRKRRGPKRFDYVTAKGKKLGAAEAERINKLAIPPAWTDVFIAPSPRADLQAVGRDVAGRWQYRYHPSFTDRQAMKKYRRLLKFAGALPRMRRVVDAHMRQRGLGHDRVMAGLLKILATVFVRVGSSRYAALHGSFGLATLRRKHVTVRGDTIIFDYPGKSGQHQHREMKDRRVAKLVRECLATPGHEVFKYITDDGVIVDVKRHGINAYIKSVMGADYSAKDFRTWAGTLICACALAKVGFDPDESQTARKKKVNAAIKETASHLGNTPTVCRASYVNPSVLSSFDKGEVLERFFEDVGEMHAHNKPTLAQPEKALVTMLEDTVEAAKV